VKRKLSFHIVVGLFLALGWISFQSWQSLHRYHEHYLEAENEHHHECQMCDWDVPLVDLAEVFQFSFVLLEAPIPPSNFLGDNWIDYFVTQAIGRGPPFIKAL
jgi:hypothetical protein